jgi:DNA-binding transcriptional regulator YdaS (Cro superfamily)
MKLEKYFFELSMSERQNFIEELAILLNKKESTIRSYINGNRSVQPKDAKNIENKTEGKVTTAELCPLVFGKSA